MAILAPSSRILIAATDLFVARWTIPTTAVPVSHTLTGFSSNCVLTLVSVASVNAVNMDMRFYDELAGAESTVSEVYGVTEVNLFWSEAKISIPFVNRDDPQTDNLYFGLTNVAGATGEIILQIVAGGKI